MHVTSSQNNTQLTELYCTQLILLVKWHSHLQNNPRNKYVGHTHSQEHTNTHVHPHGHALSHHNRIMFRADNKGVSRFYGKAEGLRAGRTSLSMYQSNPGKSIDRRQMSGI